jgi:hypothetical protein
MASVGGIHQQFDPKVSEGLPRIFERNCVPALLIFTDSSRLRVWWWAGVGQAGWAGADRANATKPRTLFRGNRTPEHAHGARIRVGAGL